VEARKHITAKDSTLGEKVLQPFGRHRKLKQKSAHKHEDEKKDDEKASTSDSET